MDTNHTIEQIPGYILGILPDKERDLVEQHVRACSACRLALMRERRLANMVRQAIQTAAQPNPIRLATLRPPIPARSSWTSSRLYRQMAPVGLVILFLAAGLFGQLFVGKPQRAQMPPLTVTIGSPTVTATATQTPAATLASVIFPTELLDSSQPLVNSPSQLMLINALPDPYKFNDANPGRKVGEHVGSPRPLTTPIAIIWPHN